MANFISEDQIEKAAVKLLTEKYGYRSVNCYTADLENSNDRSNRRDKFEVVFCDVLKRQLIRLNPAAPESAVDVAIERLTALRSGSLLTINRELYGLLRDGVPVQTENEQGRTEDGLIKVIDFDHPENNDFLAVTQLWIKGERYPRRPDLLVYINGLPLVFIELKNSNVPLKTAYSDNLTNYRRDIPQLFRYNALCVLSNAIDTRVGSFTAGYEHYFCWLRPEDESEKVNRKSVERAGTSLERLLEGIFPKDRLLDYIENFILYYEDNAKIIAQNHQFIGVNKAIESFANRAVRRGKLGVFWHTQGSGKSFSMIFLSRKIFRKFSGNFTFVIVTDREDLDGQIYRNFLRTGAVTEQDAAQPKDSAQLREYLGRNKRIVFTLIHKFRFDKGREYPLLSDRNDIIVIVDEAHRTQYAALAENMRKGLPNAQYFAFTGTPLLGQGKGLYQGKTYDWFGGYVSQYNFVQSIDDGATVPLFYQKRVPEVLIQNETLSEEFYQILEEENLDEKAQEKLEREFSQEIEVIKRDDRLETIARDIVAHYVNRGYLGKAMVISVDKFTSVKMYDKVQKYWRDEIMRLRSEINKTAGDERKRRLREKLDYMNTVEMAVVISEEAGEEEKFLKQGLNIKPHRLKLNEIDASGHDIEYRFKDAEDKLRLVFVCAMWLTGFDAPTISTLYLDKPMKDHTLMQTIARANRVSSHTINGVAKINGELIDYYNVFRNMRKALSDYARGDGEEDAKPVEDKSGLFELLNDAVEQGVAYCLTLDIDLPALCAEDEPFSRLSRFKSFADKLLEKDENWKEFKVYENTVSALYEACKPEILGKYNPVLLAMQYLRGVTESVIGQADIEDVKRRIADLLDQSMFAEGKGQLHDDFKPEFQVVVRGKMLDISKIDFDKLKVEFKSREYKNIEITNLRQFIEHKLEEMLKANVTRADFAEKLQQVVDRYNSGGMATENYFDELVDFTEQLNEENNRHIREGLSEDELELFDILKKEKMTKDEEIKVKNASRHLLKRLKEEQPKVLVQDWYKDNQCQMIVKGVIEEVLDHELPVSYDKNIFKEKSKRLFELVYEFAVRGIRWAA